MSAPELSVERVRRVSGTSGALYFVATLGATALIASTGTTEQQMEQAAVDAFLPGVAASPVVAAASMLGYVVSMVLLIWFAVGLHRLIRTHTPVGHVAPAVIVLGAVLFIVESLLTVGIVLELAPAYVGASGPERAAIGATGAALLGFRSYTALTAGALVSAGAIGYGLAIRRTDVLSGWLGSVAILLGVLGLVGVLWPVVPAVSYLRQIAYFLFTAWALVVGVILLRR